MEHSIKYSFTFIEETQKNDVVKALAMILMVIDHVGLAFFPNIIIFRILGRLAFPIFAYGIANGYVHTKNLKKYVLRLSALAIISQPIYKNLVPSKFNIFFTLLIGLILIYSIDKKKYWISVLMIGISIIAPLDYGIYGLGVILLFYIFRENLILCIFAQFMLVGIYSINTHTLLQTYSLLAMPLIFIKWNVKFTINKYFAYLFYPLHLGIIALILYMK